MTTIIPIRTASAGRKLAIHSVPVRVVIGLACAGWYMLAPSGPSRAETIQWDTPTGGNWNQATNWNPIDVPDEPGEEALFLDTGGAFTVTLDTSPTLDAVAIDHPGTTLQMSGRTLTLLEPAGLDCAGTILASGGTNRIQGNLSLGVGGGIDIHGGSTLLPTCPILINDGTITVNANQSSTNAMLRFDVSTLLQGGGEVVLMTGGAPSDAVLSTLSVNETVTQADLHTIRGEGEIRAPLVNEGTISADDATGRPLVLKTFGKTNNAILQTTGDGVMHISTGIGQGPGGIIQANGGDIVLFSGTTITGGTLATTGPGRIVQSASTSIGLVDINNQGQFDLQSGASCVVSGTTLTNDGVITINSDQLAGNAILRFDSDVSLTGGGTVVLQTNGQAADAELTTLSANETVTQAAGHTIRGEGEIRALLVNEGTISADDATGRPLVLKTYGKTNNAILQTTGGGVMDIRTGIDQGPGGIIQANGGDIVLFTGTTITGGTLATTGPGRIIQSASTSIGLTDINNQGQFDLQSGASCVVSGTTLTNDGVITINSDQLAGNAVLRFDSDVSLTGGGTVVLQTNGQPADAELTTLSANETVTQAAGHTIRGEGEIRALLVNEGTISADDATGRPLVLKTYGKTNNAILQTAGDGVMHISTGIDQGPGGIIQATGGDIVLFNGTTITGGTLATTGPGRIVQSTGTSIGLADITNQGSFDLRNGTSCVVSGTTLTNDGVITINSDQLSGNAVLRFDSDVLLTGGGTVVLQTNGQAADAEMNTLTTNETVTQAAGHTIRGEGEIRARLVSQGAVIADANGQALVLMTYPKINDGVFRAEGNGTLQITTTAFTNHGVAEATTGGLFQTAALPNHVAGHTLTGGTWRVGASSTMRLVGTTIDTLDAAIVLDGLDSNLYGDNATTDALAGLVELRANGAFTIQNGRDFTTVAGLDNAGRLTVGDASTLALNGALNQSTSGWLGGTGQVIASQVVSSGKVSPGASIGILTIAGDYEQIDTGELHTGTLEIELGGTEPGESDRLDVTGHATLGGRLHLETAGGFQVADGDSFTVMTYGSHTGEFDAIWGACPSPNVCVDEVIYTANEVIVVMALQDPTGIEDPEEANGETPAALLPESIRFAARPSPFAAQNLELDLPRGAEVELQLFDVSGRSVAALRDGFVAAGRHSFPWDGRLASGARASNGVYFARAILRIDGGQESRLAKFVVVR